MDTCAICDKPFGKRPSFPPERPVYHNDCLDRETAWVQPLVKGLKKAALRRS